MSVRKPTSTKKASQRRASSRGGMPARPTTKASNSPSLPSAVHAAKGRGDHDQDEDEGRDELDPRIEPVQRAGPRAMALEPLKPHGTWPLRSAGGGKILAIPQATPKTTSVPTRPAAAVASLTCSTPGSLSS